MSTVSRPLACLTVLGMIIITLAPLANADIPQMINYQAKVTDTGGTPVADGD
jgi:hypothetical protein